MTQHSDEQNNPDLVETRNLLREARPEVSALRLDEIKRDVMSRPARTRRARTAVSLQRRLLALTLFVMLFAISTSNAAANILNFVSAGSLGKTVGKTGNAKGTQFFFSSYKFGGDKTDDAGNETYCKDDKGSDDNDASSGDNSDGDKYSDDKDASSGDQSDESGGKYSMATGGGGGGDECDTDGNGGGSEKSDDNDKSSGDHSDEKSDDNDASSGDNSDRDPKSDDRDASSGDHSDEKSDDNDASSGDHSDW